MHTLTGHSFRVQLLDPVDDRDRMGPRYCTGGYIFQVEDDDGALLSGPTFPETFNWFDGQGIPDSFALAPLRDPKEPGSLALVPGIGVCDTSARGVREHTTWSITQVDAGLRFETRHVWASYEMAIERVVTVHDRVIRSHTVVRNLGGAHFPVIWFPHPFYPPIDGALCSLPGPVAVPEGTTYSVGADGFLRCSDPGKHMSVAVSCDGGSPLAITQRHPRLGLVAARFSFPAGYVLVWANERTFSFEPYLERTVGVGSALSWTAEYQF